jgi:hypothetical protein
MFKIFSHVIVVFVLCSLVGCGSAPAAGSAPAPAAAPPPADDSSAKLNEGRSAAAAAIAAMERAEQGSSQTSQAGASARPAAVPRQQSPAAAAPAATPAAPAPAAAPRGEPGWVTVPYSVYRESDYVAASGHGANRNAAEKNALAALTAVFGQSIQADLKLMSNYSEAIKNGVVDVSENNSLQEAITTSTEMDSLVGAEIKDVWYDGTSVYYAVAVMERAKTAVLYTDMIRSNERIITELITIPAAQRNTLDAYSRYQLAATIADANRVYANVLSIVNKGSGGVANLKKGDDYRLEAANITKNIPIAVRVNNDRSDRIRGAFAAVISKAGFRSGGNNSRYVLNVTLTLSEVQLANQQNKFARYVVDANLTDTAEGMVLLPYNINGREGHLNLPEAENRAVAAAEKKINEAYGGILSEYLSTLLPRR